MSRKRNIEELGDFTTTTRVIPISLLAIAIGAICAGVAWAFLHLINVVTNIAYFHRWSADPASPALNTLGVFALFIPIVGGLIIGLMARFGSDRIRGHGIPEAIEAILMNGSRVQPRVGLLKALSSAISIGTGGPFGAEGPIIMTGGSLGSVIAQFFHLTAAERKTLLVAGAAAGMSATFAAPIAATLLAVELLLFEWKPRSFIPVALASAVATAIRYHLLGLGPLFPVPHHPAFIGSTALLSCVLVGVLAGALSALLTIAVYGAEDLFQHLPIHWMWWPAIGGVAIGIGGLIFPQGLGVGYDTIGTLLQGDVAGRLIIGVLVVKASVWAFALGSGTSGGVLAPLLMMGAALGAVEAKFLPAEGSGFWELISFGAILGGTMRAPFTGIVFAVELTHDWNALLPLLIACTVAHGFTVLTLKRSILTEKVSRRGYHLSREYAVDPLELLFVDEVMSADVPAADQPAAAGTADRGLVVRRDETLRTAVNQMAEHGVTRLRVADDDEVVGIVTLEDLLRARVRHLEEERDRSRTLHLPPGFGLTAKR